MRAKRIWQCMPITLMIEEAALFFAGGSPAKRRGAFQSCAFSMTAGTRRGQVHKPIDRSSAADDLPERGSPAEAVEQRLKRNRSLAHHPPASRSCRNTASALGDYFKPAFFNGITHFLPFLRASVDGRFVERGERASEIGSCGGGSEPSGLGLPVHDGPVNECQEGDSARPEPARARTASVGRPMRSEVQSLNVGI